MRKIQSLFVIGLLGSAIGAGIAQAAPADLVKKCEGCHGADGNGSDLNVPNIAGMSAVYIGDTLLAYKAGDRPGIKYKPKDGDESDMATVAKSLSEEDIKAVAAHFAGKTYQMHPQDVDAALAAQGKQLFADNCDRCHSDGGTIAEDDSSLLAGQGKPYLQKQFENFTSGARQMPKKMAKRFEKLDDAGKAAVIEYLAGGAK